MDSGYTVGAVRADNSEISHSNLARRPFLYQADAFNTTFVSREMDKHLVEKSTVDFVDDLELTRQKKFKPGDRPFLESLGQKGVIGVRQRFPGEIPSLAPSQVCIVEQNAHQFGDRHRRVCVIKLNRRLVGEFFPICVVAQEAAYQVGQRT